MGTEPNANKVHAMIQGHPWDLWGLAQLFDGGGTGGLLVQASMPHGEPRIDHQDAESVQRFRRTGYDKTALLCANVLEEALARGDTGDKIAAIADELITSINGAAKLLDPEYYQVRLCSVISASGGIIVANRTPNKGFTHLGRHPSQAIAAAQFISLAEKNRSVAFVLEAFNLPITWASLYLVYDCIVADVGGVHELKNIGWVTKDSLTDFTNTANNARDIRAGIRHGKDPDATPKRPLIRLHQGHDTVMRLTMHWLNWLIDQKA